MWIILGCLALISIGIIAYRCGRASVEKSNFIIDEESLRKKQELEAQIEIEKDNLSKLISDYKSYQDTLQSTLENYKSTQQELMDKEISKEYEIKHEKMMKKIEDLEQTELIRLTEKIDEIEQKFVLKMTDWNSAKDSLNAQIQELRDKRAAAIQIAKHEEEIRKQADFYKLNLSEEDVSDYWELKRLEKKLNRTDVLNKLIYKTYFEKPYTNLIGRVVGAQKKTGIYKITNINDHKIYIGQAVDIAERWKQHIKRGIGAEPATQNKLYPAMKEEGVWNFTFEIVEECEKAKLGEREQYYQNFFGAKEFGYSIK